MQASRLFSSLSVCDFVEADKWRNLSVVLAYLIVNGVYCNSNLGARNFSLFSNWTSHAEVNQPADKSKEEEKTINLLKEWMCSIIFLTVICNRPVVT